ncbi:hypothetical protein LIER_41368 [Lithospermum erythrorhizon]|uniref:Uncharacterized protein n=1 Tax=Lithospermum erythrorhizon TaxID=34254 RepID=A0AAV3RBN9_LITER
MELTSSYALESGLIQGRKVTSMVSQDQGHITVLPKLCYEQLSKSPGAHKWSTTVQIARLGEGPENVKTALLQLQDKGRIVEMRAQGFPFDDKG